MIGREPTVEDLHAYHDGELTGLARWRVRRWLARSPEARRELEILARSVEWIRELDRDATPAPDLWDAIAARLPAIDARQGREAAAQRAAGERRQAPAKQGREAAAQRAAGERRQAPARLAWLLRPAAAVAAVAAAAALAFFVLWPQTESIRAVRSLDTNGRPVMVFEGEATIIWLIDAPPPDVSQEGPRGVV